MSGSPVNRGSTGEHQVGSLRCRVSANSAVASSVVIDSQQMPKLCPLYVIYLARIGDEFTSTIYNATTQGMNCQERDNCTLLKNGRSNHSFNLVLFRWINK